MALVLLGALVEGLHIVMERTHRGSAMNKHSETILRGLLPPTNVSLVARLLRTDIGIELLVGGLHVLAYALGLVAVGIVLDGTSAVELRLVHVVRQLHHHAEAKHVGQLGAVGLHGLSHLDASIDINDIRQGKLNTTILDAIRHIHMGFTVTLASTDVQDHQLGRAPEGIIVVHVSTHVIIRNGSPEERLQRSSIAKKVTVADPI